MSVLLFLAAATATAAPPSPEAAQEIVVLGRKAKRWEGGVSKVGGRMICKTSRSSGDKAVDMIRCGALLSCLKPLEPRIDALMDSGLPSAEKRRGFQAILGEAVPCLDDYSDKALGRLAHERVGT